MLTKLVSVNSSFLTNISVQVNQKRAVTPMPEVEFGSLGFLNTIFSKNIRAAFVSNNKSWQQFSSIINRTPIENSFNKTEVVITGSVHRSAMDKYIQQLTKQHPEMIVSVGSGSVTDWGKALAKRLSIPVTTISTTTSTNAMFTKWVVIRDGKGEDFKVSTEEGVMPQRVIFEPSLLTLNHRANTAGIGDLLSVYTALYDWDLAIAAGEEISDPKIYNSVKEIFESLNLLAEHIKQDSTIGMKELIDKLYLASVHINQFGSGRPESGAEHILTNQIDKILSRKGKQSYHGELVAISVLVLSILQGREPKKIFILMQRIGIPTKIHDLPVKKEELKEALLTVKPRPGRYTWLDEIDLTQKKKDIDNALYLLFESEEYFTR